MSPLPQKPDIMGTVTVGSDRQKPTSHASALRNWGFLPGAAEVGFFRFYPGRTPHDSRGRNWGRSELNRESDTPKGTGQLPACELVGWLKIEAQGCTEGPSAVHIRSTRKGVKPNPSFLSMGKGGFRVNLMNWGVSMTFRKVLCPHCRGKLETGQRIHAECVAPWADAQAEKAKRADAKAARMAAKVERASIRARKEAIKTIADLKREARQGFFGRQRSISSRSAGTPAMRTFSHCARVSRSVPCTNSLSGATGGRPVFLRSFMPVLSVPQERIANAALLCHNNTMQTVVKTLKIRVKDKHASVLRRMPRPVNFVWSF